MDHVLDLVLGIDLLLKPNSSLMVTLQNRETKRLYNLHYVVADILLSVQDDNFYYGIGMSDTAAWKHLTRDLLVDLQKGIQQIVNNGGRSAVGSAPSTLDKLRKKLRRTDVKVTAISILGSGMFDNLTLATTEHISQFYDAGMWSPKRLLRTYEKFK